MQFMSPTKPHSLILMSNSAIKTFAIVGAALVPIAVPIFWMNNSELN
jgi:hypothetical protein